MTESRETIETLTEDQETRMSRMRDAGLFTGSVSRGLEILRRKLLDTSPRNRLLNFRHPRSSSLRVIDELPGQIFQALTDGRNLQFTAVPKPTKNEEVEHERTYRTRNRVEPDATVPKITVTEQANKLGLQAEYDLPSPKRGGEDKQETKHRDNRIQTLFFPDDMAAVLERLRRAARIGIEEKGINLLYLAAGFLEWTDREDTTQKRYAPLILVPVALERGDVDRETGIRRFSLSHSGEDIDENLSLREKLNSDFRLTLPELVDAEDPERPIDPEQYFSSFAGMLRTRPDWKLKRWITLALFEFSKLLMYRDLDPESWPTRKVITSHKLVRPFFEAMEASDEDRGEEYADLDSAKQLPKAPLVFDADSSQHSALVDVLKGKDLVIQGPPGTGKSQTITNLIAACIGAGKSVLFVSEKMAALEVVRRRLDEAGLGHFCLELHSHRTQKRALLNDIERRIKLRKKFLEPQKLEREIRRLEEQRRAIQEYSMIVAQTWGKLGWPIQRILAAKVNLELGLGDLVSRIQLTRLDDSKDIDEIQLEQGGHLLERFVDLHTIVIKDCGNWLRHPLYGWTNSTLTYADFDEFRSKTDRLRMALSELAACERALEETLGVGQENKISSLRNLATTAKNWPVPSHGLPPFFSMLEQAQIRDQLKAFVRLGRMFEARATDAFRYLKHKSLPARPFSADFAGLVAAVVRIGLGHCDRFKIAELATLCERAAHLASAATLSFELLTDRLHMELPPTFIGLRAAIGAISMASIAPWEHLNHRSSVSDSATAIHLVSSTERTAIELRTQEQELGQQFELQTLPPREDLVGALYALKSAGALRMMSGRWRRSRSMLRAVSRDMKRLRGAEGIQALSLLIDYIDREREFKTNLELVSAYGAVFKGKETRFEIIRDIHLWRRTVRQHLGISEYGTKIAERLLEADEDFLRQIAAFQGTLAVDIEVSISAVSSMSDIAEIPVVRDLIKRDASFQDIAAECEESAALFRKLDGLWVELALKDELSVNKLADAMTLINEANGLASDLRNNIAASQVLGPTFNGEKTEFEPLEAVLKLADTLLEPNVPAQASHAAFLDPRQQTFKVIKDKFIALSVAGEEFESSCAEFAELVRPRDAKWPHGGVDERTIESLSEQVSSLPQGAGELESIVSYVRTAKALDKQGIGSIIDAVRNDTLPASAAQDARRYVIFKSMADEIVRRTPQLAQFHRDQIEDAQERYREIDLSLLELQRASIAHRADQRSVPAGIVSGRVSELTELNLIKREIAKQKRHIPIRQLIRRAKLALLGLKPCFMMSPLSVAQYLPPGELDFDVVVMDEASQIKPEEALGALARVKQVIIVGDSKQLPPTSFFQRTRLDAEAEESDEINVAEESESVLEAAATIFPQRWLRWHYRSHHESLVAFSNRYFYDDELVVLPSARGKSGQYGIVWTFVPEGRFESGRNIAEARTVAEIAAQHMREARTDTIGVVAMNLEQAELIENLVDEHIKSSPVAEKWMATKANGAEPFFVKNLENVQGDERDVIVASFTYGNGAAGPPLQNFGPINRDFGWRRLNVLYTRARKQMIVCASMRHDGIAVDGRQRASLAALSDYLRYAETGQLERSQVTKRPPESPFEEAVIRALEREGFACTPQVGSDKYRIDIGVEHPDRVGEYLLGIECDGAPFHSGRSVRDRDRIRQLVLESLGWRIHRIWSADWYKDPRSELRRLAARMNDLRAADRTKAQAADKKLGAQQNDATIGGGDETSATAHQSTFDLKSLTRGEKAEAPKYVRQPRQMPFKAPESPPVRQIGMPLGAPGVRAKKTLGLSRDEARAKLVELRENVIKQNFPQVEPAKGLLRKSMLEKLLDERPTTREEFLRMIPLYLREATDGSHVREYLDQVLDLLIEIRD